MTQLPSPPSVDERRLAGPEEFHADIRPGRQPAILRGLVKHWPVVEAALGGDAAIASYLASCEPRRQVEMLEAAPQERGRFFYNARMTDLNFERRSVSLPDFMQRLLAEAALETPAALAVQSEIIPDVMPLFAQANRLDLVPGVAPRIWIGNRIRVAAHYDLKENIACCVAGRRKFTLFPPDAVAELYPGPFELTPAGTPVSMVDMADPDLSAHPRFPQALARAQVAQLEPGDALYIPYGWWHAVESQEPVSILVNYWWSDAEGDVAGAYDALLHAVAAYRHLPAEQRAVWKTMMDHYVFETNGPPAAHIPAHARGLLGDASPALFARLRQMLRQLLR